PAPSRPMAVTRAAHTRWVRKAAADSVSPSTGLRPSRLPAGTIICPPAPSTIPTAVPGVPCSSRSSVTIGTRSTAPSFPIAASGGSGGALSGDGGQVWLYLRSKVAAAAARQIGVHLLRQAMTVSAELDLVESHRW